MLLHQRYEEFAALLLPALEKQYLETSMNEFNRKRNIMRLLSELFLKGLFAEFRKIFKCITDLVQINPTDAPEQFQNAMMVITDYFKTYGEVFF